MFQRFISFSITAALILAGMPVFISAPAQARFPRGTAAASCPQATDNGCAAAAAHGSFKSASLLTSAQQSGQNSLLPTRGGGALTLNIPGVDYGIGPDSTLTPQDPRTINDSTCAYVAAPPASYEVVECNTSGVWNYTINNYDFSGTKIGKAPVVLFFDSGASAGSVATITNSYFAIPPVSSQAVIGFTHNWSLVFKNDQCDGSLAISTSGYCFDSGSDVSGTSIDIEYSVFSNQGVPRVANGLTNATWKFDYNFVQGLNDIGDGSIHGEIMLRNCSGPRANCTSTEEDVGNFIIWNRIAVHPQNNATFFPSDGASDNVTLGFENIQNNVVVINLAGDGIGTVGNGLFAQRAAGLGVVTISGNWLDASGAGDCGINGPASGGNSVTASQTGNVVNVTAMSGSYNFGVEPGYQFFRSGGYTTSTITSFGTAVGDTGTYNVNGPSQGVASDSNWTLVPGFTSFTAANNYLLNDPGHTGVPTAIGYTGPQFSATNCF